MPGMLPEHAILAGRDVLLGPNAVSRIAGVLGYEPTPHQLREMRVAVLKLDEATFLQKAAEFQAAGAPTTKLLLDSSEIAGLNAGTAAPTRPLEPIMLACLFAT